MMFLLDTVRFSELLDFLFATTLKVSPSISAMLFRSFFLYFNSNRVHCNRCSHFAD
jgi:hypothetical protein